MPQTPEHPDRLAEIVAGIVRNDVRDTIAADENDENVYEFLITGESFDAWRDQNGYPTRVVYLVGRAPGVERVQGRKLVKITIEPVEDDEN